jgi:dTDP-4-dehydrorhamnose 3,5-epimerase
MELFSTCFPEVRVVLPPRPTDSRGFFSEVYNHRAFAQIGIDTVFVQDNHSLSVERGVVRGLHFQIPPFAQAKLVRVVRGAIFDVVVDIRSGSPSFGRSASVIVSAVLWNQLFVPEGFAHGFCTLEPDTEVLYKVSRPYSPDHDRGLLWNDPVLAIDWPVDAATAILSEKDRRQPRLAELPDFFRYEPSVAACGCGAVR